MPSLVSRPPLQASKIECHIFFSPHFAGAATAKCECHLFSSWRRQSAAKCVSSLFSRAPCAGRAAAKYECHLCFFRPPGAGAAASIISVISFFSASSRRHSRCEMCVSSLLLGPPARPQLLRSVWHLFFSRPPAPAQPLRSVSVVSLFLAPLRWHSRFDV